MASSCRSLLRLDVLFAASVQRGSRLRPSFSRISYFSSSAIQSDEPSSGVGKPETMEWNKELSNSISLIGTLVKCVDIKHLDSGKTFASSYVKVKRPTVSGLKDDSIFFVQFWNELAESAAAHFKAGDHIFVAGSVWIENFLGNDNVQRTACKIVARDLKFVEGGHTQEEGEELKLSVDEQWKDYFDNHQNYWDNRVDKKNPRGPDFKHKINGSALWIDSRSTPSWVKSKLENPDIVSFADCDEDASYIPIATGGIESEELWQMFFGNPSDWWDNRNRKKNPKYPDFKHKVNGSALWIDSRSTPLWVKEKLEGLDLVLTEDSGEDTVPVSSGDIKSEKLWQAFFANPSEWWDNRNLKKHPRGPDFKHKSTGEALWIGSFSGPKWVKSQLEALDKKSKAAKEQGRADWPMVSNGREKKTSFDDTDLGIFF